MKNKFMKEKIKKFTSIIILAIGAISVDVWMKEFFYPLLLLYWLFIKLLLSDFLKWKIKKAVSVSIWATTIVIAGLTFYVNWYLPHGPSYPTGEYICMNDERGPCGPEYVEDMRNLNIPDWAKFIRHWGTGLIIASVFAGISSSIKRENEK